MDVIGYILIAAYFIVNFIAVALDFKDNFNGKWRR